MASKIVTIPASTIQGVSANGTPEAKNAFLFCIGFVVEKTKHKNDTDAYLAHAIREKIDELGDRPKTMELEESEIDFIERGIKDLRNELGLTGSAWYYLINALKMSTHKVKAGK